MVFSGKPQKILDGDAERICDLAHQRKTSIAFAALYLIYSRSGNACHLRELGDIQLLFQPEPFDIRAEYHGFFLGEFRMDG